MVGAVLGARALVGGAAAGLTRVSPISEQAACTCWCGFPEPRVLGDCTHGGCSASG